MREEEEHMILVNMVLKQKISCWSISSLSFLFVCKALRTKAREKYQRRPTQVL